VPAWTLGELARRLGGEVVGDPQAELRRVAPIESAQEGDLAFLANPRYRRHLETTGASAVIVGGDVREARTNLLRVAEPYAAFARALALFHPEESPAPGVSPAAFVHPTARLGEGVTVAAGVHVGEGCELGDRCVLHPGVVLRERCRLGRETVLHPNVVLYPGTELGERVVVHAGTVLGSDGFGYATTREGHVKVPQVGRVVVEDDVEIGANTAVDRATLGETRIGRGAKIDNLVQIGHNVKVGPLSILVGQAGIAGSTRLGTGVVMAGQSGAAGHLELGDGARVGAKSAALQDVPAGETVTGIPAVPHALWRRIAAALPALPELMRRLRRVETAHGIRGKEGTEEP